MKLTDETFVLKILKLVEIKSLEHNAKIVDLRLNKKIIDHINDNYTEVIKYFEKKNKAKISFVEDNELNLEDYIIEFKSKTKKVFEKIEKIEKLEKIKLETFNESKIINTNRTKVFKKRKFKKKYFKKKSK